MKKSKKIVLMLVAIMVSVLAYFCSYPFLLPLFEKIHLGKFAYIFYEPVEWIRNINGFLWEISEKGYRICGGEVCPYDRVYFKNSIRRRILRYDNGRKYEDVLLRNNDNSNIRTTVWYENGIIHHELEWYDNSYEKKRIERNPQGVIINSGRFQKNGDGFLKWFDDNGKEIASVTFKKCFKPMDGSMLVPPILKNGKLIRYLIFYKNGKEVDRKVYSEKSLK